MARLRISESVGTDSLYRDPSTPPLRNQQSQPQTTVSPTPSQSSDKENPPDTRQRSKSSMTTVETSERASSTNTNTNANKRRRLGERPDLMSPAPASQSSRPLQEQPNGVREKNNVDTRGKETRYFDPHQSMDDRRKLRRDMRDLSKDVIDNSTEWLQPDSRGLEEALTKGDNIYRSVKQTSDATIDSSFLVSAGDIAYKRSRQANIGQHAQGIDVDDFVGKCITFMRGGDDADAGTQRRRRRAAAQHVEGSDDDEEADDGDALNWEHLGATACLPVNSRPSTMSFLLGPLSLVKRPRTARAKNQRRAQDRLNPANATQPVEMRAQDAASSGAESAGLKATCERLYKLFKKESDTRMAKASDDFDRYQDEHNGEEMPEEDRDKLFEKYHLADDGGMAFLPLIIHPTSFGQTVENLFHISFLVKDLAVAIELDGRNMPSLHDIKSIDEKDHEERSRTRGKQQHVFNLDFDTWRELIDWFGLEGKKSIIPDRSMQEQQRTRVAANGWYN
ncbi:MAG: nuclear protein [Chrysothrix sp. TS-e1954]|nr:MAG: nuclear protein [Chrysothrix sp. TS-e1954]